MSKIKIWLVVIVALTVFFAVLYFQNGPKFPRSDMTYGVSFSIVRSTDLKLPWKDVYNALLNDLKVKNLRLAAYWPLVESKQGTYDFKDLDYQMNQAASHGAKVVLAIGRRLPGWPECHDPTWFSGLSSSDGNTALEKLVTTIVNRYKNNAALSVWQVENEPFFDIFSRSRNLCNGSSHAEVTKEVAMVKSLDPNHKIILTDGGELGTWIEAYRGGDIFGTSIYLYVWNSGLGYIRYPITAAYFRIKIGLMRLFFGNKPASVIELQSEPWIPRPLVEVPIDEQLSRFNLDHMNELITYPYQSGFQSAYLWGAEWWYWMKLHQHPEFWDRARQLFVK